MLSEISTKEPGELSKEELEQRIEILQQNFQRLQPPYTTILSEEKLCRRKFPNYEAQLEGLKKRFFCTDITDEECKRKLQQTTYFRLRGYFVPLQKHLANERGTPPENMQVPFKTAIFLYERDERMRLFLLEILQDLEIFLRSQLSYIYADKHGAYGYLNNNFYFHAPRNARNPGHDHNRFLSKLVKRVQENKKLTFVQHYLQKYEGIMPLWAVSELMDFGDLTYFYKDWLREEQTLFLKSLYRTSKPELCAKWDAPQNSAGYKNAKKMG